MSAQTGRWRTAGFFSSTNSRQSLHICASRSGAGCRNWAQVDRVACPWLIRTFIDRDAEFLFAPVGEVESVARKTGAIPYDVAGVELGHHGEECSFDAIVKKYNVKDEAIGRLALIVRGADTPRRDLTPESPGLEAIAEGFKRLAAAEGYDDHETIRRERHVYDALYLYCGGDPKKLRRD
jgi:hypothetical protein